MSGSKATHADAASREPLILAALKRAGRALTAAEINEAIGVNYSARLGKHLSMMEKKGLIEGVRADQPHWHKPLKWRYRAPSPTRDIAPLKTPLAVELEHAHWVAQCRAEKARKQQMRGRV